MSQNDENVQVERESVEEDPKRYFSLKYLVISLTLSAIGMAVVIYYTYTPGIFEHLAFKRLPGLLIALVVSVMRVWFSAAKIRYLANKEVSWLAAFRIVLVWDFTSAITPSSIGGAPMATYAMSKENLALGKSTAIILYAMLLDMFWFALVIPILIVSGFYFAVIPANIGWVGEGVMFVIYFALLTYASLLTYAVLVNPTILKKIIKIIFRLPFLRRFRSRMEKEAEILEETSHELKDKPMSFLFKAFILSSMSWLCRIWLPTIVVLSFLPADVVLSFFRSMAMNLAGLFMPTPGGSGGMEGLFALFQGPLMSKKGFIGISVFMWRLISYYISIGLGMMATTWYLNRSVVETISDSDEKGDHNEHELANEQKADLSL
ncbi:MAG TPA: lysylphosphatidylglycerol synthase transmembrane domain-containing protein [Balneolales bacterium]|nr:lysylphosphatidylglycerol synthase transmembrane domain-containing protein [Balneolales bacterium]